jgi:hypothetical protein
MAVDSDGQAFRVFGIGRLPAVALIALTAVWCEWSVG